MRGQVDWKANYTPCGAYEVPEGDLMMDGAATSVNGTQGYVYMYECVYTYIYIYIHIRIRIYV